MSHDQNRISVLLNQAYTSMSGRTCVLATTWLAIATLALLAPSAAAAPVVPDAYTEIIAASGATPLTNVPGSASLSGSVTVDYGTGGSIVASGSVSTIGFYAPITSALNFPGLGEIDATATAAVLAGSGSSIIAAGTADAHASFHFYLGIDGLSAPAKLRIGLGANGTTGHGGPSVGSSAFWAYIDGWNNSTNASLFPNIRWSETNPPPFGGVIYEIDVNNNDVFHFWLYGRASATINGNAANISSYQTTRVIVDPNFEVTGFAPGDTPVLWASPNLPAFVPEPASWQMALLGLGGLLTTRRFRISGATSGRLV